MTDHEMVVLRAAVEGVQADGLVVSLVIEGFAQDPEIRKVYDPDDASALLTDLGADVPEWPSAERVAELLAEEPPRRPALLASLPLPEYLALRGAS